LGDEGCHFWADWYFQSRVGNDNWGNSLGDDQGWDCEDEWGEGYVDAGDVECVGVGMGELGWIVEDYSVDLDQMEPLGADYGQHVFSKWVDIVEGGSQAWGQLLAGGLGADKLVVLGFCHCKGYGWISSGCLWWVWR